MKFYSKIRGGVIIKEFQVAQFWLILPRYRRGHLKQKTFIFVSRITKNWKKKQKKCKSHILGISMDFSLENSTKLNVFFF